MDVDGSPAPPQPGTRHYTLLHSNEPPDSSEIAFIQSTSSRIGTRLGVLDQEIARLTQLTAERAALVSYNEQNKAVLSPVRRVPNEILVEIFVRSLPSAEEGDGYGAGTFSMKKSPWALTHVCSRWRAVSISTPSLWSLLVPCFYGFGNQPLPAIEAQIQRATMLRIRFYGSTRGLYERELTEKDLHSQTEIFRYLAQFSARWEELNLLVTPRLIPLLPLLRDRLPSLRRLWPTWESEDDSEDDHSDQSPFDYFQTADSLVHLGVNRDIGIHVGEPYPITIVAPPNQLTRYCVDASWATHRGILSTNPTLIEAYVNIIPSDVDEEWPDHGEIFDLPQLRCLYISHFRPLPHFKVPVLEQVTLEISALQQWVGTKLEHFIANTSSTIRRLGLKGVPDRHLARMILQSFSHLEELAIIIFWYSEDPQYNSDSDWDWEPEDITSALISLLHPRTLLCPRLSHIHLGFRMGVKATHTAFLTMLESRWKVPDCALEAATLVLDGGAKPDDETRARIDSLRQDGLQFSLTTEDKHLLKTMASWMCTLEWDEHRTPSRLE